MCSMVQPSLNGIDLESYLSIERFNPYLNGIEVQSYLWV